jgi:hypothetical protein
LACLLLAVGTWASWRPLLRFRIWDYLNDVDFRRAGLVLLIFFVAAAAVCWGTPERVVWLARKLREDRHEVGEDRSARAVVSAALTRARARSTVRRPRARVRLRDQDWDDRW